MHPPENEKLISYISKILESNHQSAENQVKLIQAGGNILSEAIKALLFRKVSLKIKKYENENDKVIKETMSALSLGSLKKLDIKKTMCTIENI
jgi:hypothetical protein